MHPTVSHLLSGDELTDTATAILAPVLWMINRHFRRKLSHYSRAASDSFSRVTATLAALRSAAATSANLMPLLIDAVRAYATLGEICDALREVWGEYEETPVI